jgi:hypothetical protein
MRELFSLNPGNVATGAYSAAAPSSVPSFLILDVKKDQLTVYQCQLTALNQEMQITQYNHSLI